MSCHQGITSDDVDYNTTWNTLKDAFTKIHEKEASNLSYEELYRFAYRLVLKKQGERLYDNVKSFEAEWLQEKVQPQIISKISSTLQSQDGGVAGAAASANERREAGERFLTTLRASWNDHVTAMNMLADVLMYMVGDAVRANDVALHLLTRKRTAFTAPTPASPTYTSQP